MMPTSDESVLGVFERIFLRTIYGLLCIGDGESRRRLNDELYKSFGGIGIVQSCRIGHVVRVG